jgi:hypothetical protein
MTNFEYFINKYRNSDLLIDTNLLIVFLVGSTDEKIIDKVKPTRAYSREDYQFLLKLIKHFRVVTTPHILTEASNSCEKTEKHHKEKIMQQFSQTVINLIEIPIPSKEAVKTPVFRKLGLSDSIIFELGKKGLVVLTDDLELHSYLLGNNITAANINHFRSEYLLIKRKLR